jgi:hypothetical protein
MYPGAAKFPKVPISAHECPKGKLSQGRDSIFVKRKTTKALRTLRATKRR